MIINTIFVKLNTFANKIPVTHMIQTMLTITISAELSQNQTGSSVGNIGGTGAKSGGPVEKTTATGEQASMASDVGFAVGENEGLYQFGAILNLNLAVINLLPLPSLDGGSLALILVEAAKGGGNMRMKEREKRFLF